MTNKYPPLPATSRTVCNSIQVLIKTETTGRWRHFDLQNRKRQLKQIVVRKTAKMFETKKKIDLHLNDSLHVLVQQSKYGEKLHTEAIQLFSKEQYSFNHPGLAGSRISKQFFSTGPIVLHLSISQMRTKGVQTCFYSTFFPGFC